MRFAAIPFALFVSVFISAPTGAAEFSTPAAVASQPAKFWAEVMTGLYGPYDKNLKCWTGKFDGQAMCMRPHKLAAQTVAGKERLYLAVAGAPVEAQLCHACSGNVGFIVMEKRGDRFEKIAQNDLYQTMGSWGSAPSEESFALQQIGPDNYGWTVEMGYTAQGYTGSGISVYAMEGAQVRGLGYVPNYQDNCGAVEDQSKCETYSFDLSFEPPVKGPYYTIHARQSATSTASPIGPDATISYDAKEQKYKAADNYASLLEM